MHDIHEARCNTLISIYQFSHELHYQPSNFINISYQKQLNVNHKYTIS